MIKYLIYILIGIPIAFIAISFATILKQGVSLTDEPGFKTRLSHFMNHNTVETSSDHNYPELRTKSYQISKKQLKQHIIDVVMNLGWELREEKGDNLHIIVSSDMVKFKDDMHIYLETGESNKTLVNIKSSSRVGRADFAANLGHVVKLNKYLQQRLGSK